ncbi:VOC family protein [Streptomonospora litoralis]|uniref:Fosfomycin resistance protein FosB n=1 Tax=Streptomonospora litoralis TaxID=2498135 RepID=A0A4P6Q4I5_9ACTN|nr:VOC family protein [Streptomonospora litoralis]QBI55170.1 fosfomycin resistance protein FosB [Streptomonospora litoralis]
MPRVTGLAHITLSVRDRDASIEFYRTVLGFKEFKTRDGKQWLLTECRHPCGVVLGFIQHKDQFKATFDQRHVGMDHVALQVSSLGELDYWEERLTDLDIDHSPIVHSDNGSMIQFSDPDGIQLELFCPAELGSDEA